MKRFNFNLARWRLQHHCPLCDSALPDSTEPESTEPDSTDPESTDPIALSTENLPVCSRCFADLPWCHTTGDTLGERSAFYYAAPISEYILAGKSSSQPDKLQLLGELMAVHFTQQLSAAQHALPQAIIPVPLHKTRLRQRGFNQSIELIRPFTRQHAVPLLKQAVYRNRNTGEQKGLTESMRKSNIANAFAVHKPIAYQHIAIFDDVITTGATCAALKDLLLDAGVKTVEIWCCATTKHDLAA